MNKRDSHLQLEFLFQGLSNQKYQNFSKCPLVLGAKPKMLKNLDLDLDLAYLNFIIEKLKMGKKSSQKKPGMSKKSQPSAPLTKPEFKPLEEQGGWITTEQNKKYV